MPNINAMRDSKFLRKEDCGEGILVTVAGVDRQVVSIPGAPKEEKWVLLTKEAKPLVLNSTNMKRIAKICGSDETEDWTGKQVVLYDDENIEFGGEIVGGVRARAPRGQAARAAQATPAPVVNEDADASDLPF